MLLPEESAVGRDELMRLLAQDGISARRGIMAAHLEPAYAEATSLPVTERLTTRSLILPVFHDMTHAQQEHVVSALTSALTKSKSEISVPAR